MAGDSQGFLLTSIDDFINWARKNSTWYLLFATACCGIELMQTGGPRSDFERFGSAPRASPRQADLMIVAGTITYKMALRAKILYEQMPEPKYVVAMGSCAISGGPYVYDSYTIVRGVAEIVPVDVHIPGCPPRPEALLHGLMTLQERIRGQSMRNPGGAA